MDYRAESGEQITGDSWLMRDLWNIEKFDIVIGNPPYQDVNEKGETKHGSGKLYPEFIRGSINLLKKV